MFGYFRPYHANLTHTERQLFNSYYCRICYCLRIIGGQSARFCTTYDAAIYALILSLQSHEKEPPILPCERIGRKNLSLFFDDETGLRFACLSLISVGEKFRDDRIDHNNFKTSIASAHLKKAIEKAKKLEPKMAEASYRSTERINELQNANAPLKDIFTAYGDMAATSFSFFIEMTESTEELVRSISEWNLFMDMLCDYDEDYKNGAYNGLKKENVPTFKEYFNIYYDEFIDIADDVTSRLVKALLSVRDDSRTWNTLYKIVSYTLDKVLTDAIEGKDVSFHYFKDLFERIRENKKTTSDIKRLRIKR